MHQAEAVPRYKCTAVGDACVGKTVMVARMQGRTFKDEYVPTIVDTSELEVTRRNGTKVKLELVDTAGQEEYNELRKTMYNNTRVFLLCFALNSRTTFENTEATWTKELKQSAPQVPVVLVGMKVDLERRVSQAEAMELMRRIGATKYVECSGLTGAGIPDVLTAAVDVAHGEIDDGKRRRKKRCHLL